MKSYICLFTKSISTLTLISTLISTLTLTPTYAQAQSKDMWQTLGMVTFVGKYDPEFMMEVKVPKLSPLVEVLNGKVIEIEGYIIPLTGQTRQSHFMLSKFPQSTCFFCGKAGPETAMQVFMKNGEKVKISERKVKVKGRLIINPADATSLLYTMEDAELFE